MTDQPTTKKATAWDRLLGLISLTDAANQGTTPEQAIADAIRESVVNAPSLRNCLYPGCLRQFDMTARMNGREPARPSWSGDGWHQVTRGPSHGSVCPDHVAIVTEHLPCTVDVPNGRWMVACDCGWMSRPPGLRRSPPPSVGGTPPPGRRRAHPARHARGEARPDAPHRAHRDHAHRAVRRP